MKGKCWAKLNYSGVGVHCTDKVEGVILSYDNVSMCSYLPSDLLKYKQRTKNFQKSNQDGAKLIERVLMREDSDDSD